jgi:hypothetical protein
VIQVLPSTALMKDASIIFLKEEDMIIILNNTAYNSACAGRLRPLPTLAPLFQQVLKYCTLASFGAHFRTLRVVKRNSKNIFLMGNKGMIGFQKEINLIFFFIIRGIAMCFLHYNTKTIYL